MLAASMANKNFQACIYKSLGTGQLLKSFVAASDDDFNKMACFDSKYLA